MQAAKGEVEALTARAEATDADVKRLQSSYEGACARLEESQEEARAASEQARHTCHRCYCCSPTEGTAVPVIAPRKGRCGGRSVSAEQHLLLCSLRR